MGRSFTEIARAAVDGAGRLLIAGTGPAGSGYASDRLTVMRRLAGGGRDLTFAGGSLVRLRSLGLTHVVAAGLQKGRMLVVLARRGSCDRECPSPENLLVRFLGGTSASRCDGQRATIVGTRHGEKLVGTRHRDVIAALAGDDVVRGRGGNDLICGGRGDDRLIGGKGRDRLRGGAGRNRLRQ
jgi:Ca2+-binding RTX toxin-like protein